MIFKMTFWGEYMQSLYGDKSINISTENFPFPENGVSVILDCNKIIENNTEDEF